MWHKHIWHALSYVSFCVHLQIVREHEGPARGPVFPCTSICGGKHSTQLQNVQISSTLKMGFKFNSNSPPIFYGRQKSGLQLLRNSFAQHNFHWFFKSYIIYTKSNFWLLLFFCISTCASEPGRPSQLHLIAASEAYGCNNPMWT